MQLVRVEIERYGLLENWKLGTLVPGFNLIVGGNEAGKTTLLSFIRNVLFGFPSKTSKQAKINDYRLNPEDRLGGRIFLKSRDYPEGLTIERLSGKGGGPLGLYLPDGGRLAEEVLSRLLGNIDRTLYLNVFAFGLRELANLETLNSEELQARIYSAGTGTGAVTVPDALKRLDGEQEDIFKPSGRKPQINALLAQIHGLETELSELGSYADRYAELVRERADLEGELESLVACDRKNAALLEEKLKLFRGRAIWQEYCLAEARLNELETLPEDFPERAEDRLDELNDSIRKAGEELEELKRRLGKEKAEFVRKEELEKIYSFRGKITPIERGLGQYDKALEDLPQRKAELNSTQKSLSKQVEEINPRWTEENLLGFDNSIATRDRSRTMRKSIDDSRRKLIEAEQSVHHAEEEFDRSGQACIQAESEFKRRLVGRLSLTGYIAWPVAAVSLVLGVWLIIAGDILVGGALAALVLGMVFIWFQRQEGRKALGKLHIERADRQNQLDSEKKKKQEASLALKSKQEEFSLFLRDLGLEETLSPDALGDVFGQVGLAREEHEKAGQLKERIGEIEGFIEGYHRQVCELFKELGSPEPERKETTGAVGKLLQDLERARKYNTDQEKHEQNLELFDEQIGRQKNKLEGLIKNKERLIAVSAREGDKTAETFEDRFLRHAKVAADRDVFLNRKQEARSQLAVHAGSPDNLEEYMDELKKVSFDRLEEEIDSLQEERNKAEQEKERINQQLGENNKELTQVSTETRAGKLRLEREVAVERLTELAERWAVLTLAAQAVRRATERYERERQPEVLRHGQRYFEKMTSGRYDRIFNPPGQQRIEVRSARGRRLPPGKLSRGTAEQLYLALRLGLIEERKTHSEPVPIMMDDILVNFDPPRAAAACQAIARIAKSHQVIYLTCHPHIVELFQKQLPKANMLSLDIL